MTTLRRPYKCGQCNMFGHNSQNCHLTTIYGSDEPIFPHRYAMRQWQRHCVLNEKWIERGGAGHTLPEPKVEDFIKKTQFELACENDCKITNADECCICMESLGEKNKVTTACGHQFHFGCLHQHTTRSNACPLCRSVIVPKLHQKDAEEEESDDEVEEVEEEYRITHLEMDGVLNSISCSNSLLEIIPDIEQRTLVNDVYSRRIGYWLYHQGRSIYSTTPPPGHGWNIVIL